MDNLTTYKKIVNQRQILGEILPLDMPLGITIHVTNLCNFKCFYCSASQPKEKRKGDGVLLEHMPYQDFVACVDSIKHAGRVKILNLCGWGEPLVHPNIVEMVRYAKGANIADCIRIISNGSLLTPEMSDSLISVGLNNIRISLQGLDAEMYQQISGIKLDFEQFVRNIAYFYDHRGQSTISLRILEHMIKGRVDEFRQIFAPICNDYTIGNLIEVLNDIDVRSSGANLDKTFSGAPQFKTAICSMPLFRGYIDVDSRLMACCMIPQPRKFGDVRKNFYDVWNGKEHISFCLEMLQDKSKYSVCKTCNMYATLIEEPDKLDDYRDNLIKKYTNLLNCAK